MPRSTVLSVHEETLEALSDDWSALLKDSPEGHVFLGPSWLRAWLHVFGNGAALHVWAVREDGRLLGVGAFIADGDRLVLAGDPETWDYAGIVAAPGQESDVTRALVDHVARQGWREIVLWGLDERSEICRRLPEIAADCGYDIRCEEEAVCPTVDLPGSWDEYLVSLGKKPRHELRRKMRRFAESGNGEGDVVALTRPEDIAAAMPDFIRLHVESREDKAAFMTPQMEHFFQHITADLAQEGAIRLYFVERDGDRVASILCLDAGDSLLLYNSGYDPRFAHASAGLVSKALCLREAIATGKRRINFLRGAERYKYELGGHDERVLRCTLTLSG